MLVFYNTKVNHKIHIIGAQNPTNETVYHTLVVMSNTRAKWWKENESNESYYKNNITGLKTKGMGKPKIGGIWWFWGSTDREANFCIFT
jgi:hypothetical protein